LIEFIDEICQFNDAFKNRRRNSAKKISAKITADLIYGSSRKSVGDF
jgi:hypothetical protein